MTTFSIYEKVPFPFDPVAFFETFLSQLPVMLSTNLN